MFLDVSSVCFCSKWRRPRTFTYSTAFLLPIVAIDLAPLPYGTYTFFKFLLFIFNAMTLLQGSYVASSIIILNLCLHLLPSVVLFFDGLHLWLSMGTGFTNSILAAHEYRTMHCKLLFFHSSCVVQTKVKVKQRALCTLLFLYPPDF